MKTSLTFLAMALGIYGTNAQNILKRASMDELGNISEKTEYSDAAQQKETGTNNIIKILEFGAPSYPIKNTRGVALADLDGDGVEEIIFGIDTKLYAMKGDGSFWFQKDMGKPVLLPPAIADMNGNGSPEIILNYGYATTGGAITILDNQGNDIDGWPQSFSNHWMINAPAVADIDGDGIMEVVSDERVSSTVGFVHAIRMNGSPINSNWPVQIGSTPAFTPSIGDVDGDGIKDIVIAGSSTGMNVFNINGEQLPGFPVQETGVGFSYQSPILVDLDGDGKLEIVGSNHGDKPQFYVMKYDGSYMNGWPIALDGWTYSPASVADVDDDGDYEIFMGMPHVSFDESPVPVLYGMNADGTEMNGFPIEKNDGGNEGVITIADINNDDIPDIIFGNNSTTEAGQGFLHAFSSDGSGQLEGFPIMTKGYTYMNGAVIGDVNNDNLMDLTVLSYTLNFGADVDSTFVSTYNLEVPFDPNKIIRNGYKGNNTRDGLISDDGGMLIYEVNMNTASFYPNPSAGDLNIQLRKNVTQFGILIYDMMGRKVFVDNDSEPALSRNYKLSHLQAGTYLVQLKIDGKHQSFKWIKK